MNRNLRQSRELPLAVEAKLVSAIRQTLAEDIVLQDSGVPTLMRGSIDFNAAFSVGCQENEPAIEVDHTLNVSINNRAPLESVAEIHTALAARRTTGCTVLTV